MTVPAGEKSGAGLKGRVALVTGAGKRIGRAIALALAREGVDVVVHGRAGSNAVLDEVRREIESRGSRSWLVTADLERPEESATLIERSLAASGSLDILINNASIFFAGKLATMTFDDVSRFLHVNAWAPFSLIRDFAARVSAGKVVNLLDTKITGYDREHVPYILSKQMLFSLTTMCALEYAPNIAVNGVAPGLILPPAGKDESYLDQAARTLPLRRHGSPGDIADAVIYLLKSDFVTGQVIYVDGGRHLREAGYGQDPDQ